MQNGRHNFNNRMNFHPPHHQIDRFPSQNPPIYSSYGFQPRHSSQFHHQHPNPPINPPLPYGHGGCSDYEQRLRDEVIYLHSLWHRGLPQVQNNVNNNNQCGSGVSRVFRVADVGSLTPSSTITPQIQNPHLKPLPTTPFKKKKNKKKKPNKPQIVSDKEWPVDPKPACPSPPGHGWGEFKTRTLPQTHPAPAQEQERVLAVRVHLKGLDSCIGFFHKSDDAEDDDEDDEEDYDEEEVFEFFIMMFEEHEKLREYYKTKCENGEFYCLVCGVIANKLGRKYKDCVAIVQHSVTISKTKKKIAHRAYGRVVCKVLGWDIDRLPSLPAALVGVNAVVETALPQGQLKNNDDGSEDKPTGVKREGDSMNTSCSQAELESFPDAVEKDNVNRVDDGCVANEQRDGGDNLPSQLTC